MWSGFLLLVRLWGGCFPWVPTADDTQPPWQGLCHLPEQVWMSTLCTSPAASGLCHHWSSTSFALQQMPCSLILSPKLLDSFQNSNALLVPFQIILQNTGLSGKPSNMREGWFKKQNKKTLAQNKNTSQCYQMQKERVLLANTQQYYNYF